MIGLYYYLAWAAQLFAARPDGVTVRAGRTPYPAGAAILMAAVAAAALSVMPQVVFGVSPLV